jgi:DNA-binding HxlR family transcriptional regulator
MPEGAREHHLWTPLARGLLAVGDRWTLLLVATLASGPLRLNQLHSRLPGVSTGVLGRHLQHAVDLGLVARQRYSEVPPRVEYRLTPAGQELVPAAVQIARWGIRHMWSAPNPREHLAIGQILGLLPAMLADDLLPGELPDGVLELVVQEPRGRERHLFEVSHGHLLATQPSPGGPATRMVGPPHAWVHALGPDHDHAALQITGDLALAGRLLGALPDYRNDYRNGNGNTIG